MAAELMKLLEEVRTMSQVHAATDETRSREFPRWLRRYACVMLPLPAVGVQIALGILYSYGIRGDWSTWAWFITLPVFLGGVVLAVVSMIRRRIRLGLAGLVVNAAGCLSIFAIVSSIVVQDLFPDLPSPPFSPEEQVAWQAAIEFTAQDYWEKEGKERRGRRFDRVLWAIDVARLGGVHGLSKSFIIEHLGQPDSVQSEGDMTEFEYSFTDEDGMDWLAFVRFDAQKDQVDRIGYRGADW